MVTWLALLASSAAAQGCAIRAARLFGAVDAGGSTYHPPVADFADLFDSYRAAAHKELDEPAWSAAWQKGQAMALDQAVAYALEEAVEAV
jgi:hypothetical protein